MVITLENNNIGKQINIINSTENREFWLFYQLINNKTFDIRMDNKPAFLKYVIPTTF